MQKKRQGWDFPFGGLHPASRSLQIPLASQTIGLLLRKKEGISPSEGCAFPYGAGSREEGV